MSMAARRDPANVEPPPASPEGSSQLTGNKSFAHQGGRGERRRRRMGGPISAGSLKFISARRARA